MEDFTKLDCGCHVGFDIYHKPMWGKQCPKHSATEDMYEALKAISEGIERNQEIIGYGREQLLIKALSKANGE